MKLVYLLGVVCLIAAASATKQEKSNNYEDHGMKKYEKEKYHHHHHKSHKSWEKLDRKDHGKEEFEKKKGKYVSKSAPHEVPSHEAELQADIETNRKNLKMQHHKRDQEDIHLQDLTLDFPAQEAEQNQPIPTHKHQKGHQKHGKHGSNHKAHKELKEENKSEEKLFADQAPKGRSGEPSHPVLEDTFEALSDEKAVRSAEKKHYKKPKHKKAHDKTKKDKHFKKQKKEKKHKKDKKEKKNW